MAPPPVAPAPRRRLGDNTRTLLYSDRFIFDEGEMDAGLGFAARRIGFRAVAGGGGGGAPAGEGDERVAFGREHLAAARAAPAHEWMVHVDGKDMW